MSWIIRNKETGEAVCETFDARKLKYLNTIHYEAVPVMQHLTEVNDPESKAGQFARRAA